MTSWCSPECQSCAGHRPPDVCWTWSPQPLGTCLLGWAGSAEEPGETGRERERVREHESVCVMCGLRGLAGKVQWVQTPGTQWAGD